MPTINDILEWNFRPSYFKYTADHLLTQSTKKKIDDSKEMIEKMIDRLPDGGKMPNRQSIEDVYYLFLNNCQTLFFSMTKRDIRHLIWALDFQPSSKGEKILLSNKFDIVINLIKENWKDSLIISLWHVLLKNWTDLQLHDRNRILLIDLLKGKSKAYNGSRTNILNITKHIDFFLTTDSPHNYAALLHDKKIVLSDANKLFNHKEGILGYDYFSAVAQEYIYITWSNNLNMVTAFVKGVYHFMEKHNSRKTTLLICAQIINDEVFDNNIDIVKNETIQLIGDPAVYHLWRNVDLADNEQEKVEQARRKLNILLNKEFIEVFFKKLMEDERREKYWLKFTKEISDLRVVGNEANKLYLKKTDDISKSVDNRYIQTPSIRSTCALIMYAKDFVFVEFTDMGPLLIYKKETFDKRINLKKVESVDDLKIWSTGEYACRNSARQGYVNLDIEGRITHQGRWESRVNAWMRRYYYD